MKEPKVKRLDLPSIVVRVYRLREDNEAIKEARQTDTLVTRLDSSVLLYVVVERAVLPLPSSSLSFSFAVPFDANRKAQNIFIK